MTDRSPSRAASLLSRLAQKAHPCQTCRSAEVRAAAAVPLCPVSDLLPGGGRWLSQAPFLPSHLLVLSLMGTVVRLSDPFTYCSFGEPTVRIVLQQSPGPFFCQAMSLVPGRYKKPEVVPAPPAVPPGSCALTLRSVTCSRLACHPHQPGHLAATRCAEAEPRQVLSHQKPCPGLPPLPCRLRVAVWIESQRSETAALGWFPQPLSHFGLRSG